MAGDHKMTRLLACSEEELKTYKGLDLGPTFVHPNYRHNPINGDTSASYNKPASVMHFSQSSNYTEEFLLFIDADMILTKPMYMRKSTHASHQFIESAPFTRTARTASPTM